MVRDTAAEPLVAGPFRGRHLVRLAIGLTLLPLLVSAVALFLDIGTSYHAWGDQALTELQVRDVGRHPVLVGLYSRDGWNHPGPVLFYVLSLPYQLGAEHSVGLHIGALLVNGVAIAGMALIARRLGGTPVALFTLVGCAVLTRTLGPDFLHDPWVPSIPVLPFGLLIFLVWAMTAGETRAAPVGAGVATFCVQTHAGYAPLVVPLLALGAVGLVVRAYRLRAPTPREVGRAGLAAGAVLVVLWLPPLIEQATESRGNLTEVVEYFNDPEVGDRHSLGDGYRVVADQLTLTPEWLTGADAANPFTGEPGALGSTPVPVLLAPFLLATLVAVRRRWWDTSRLAATVAVGLVVGVLSITRVVGNLFVYRLRWTWVLGVLAIVAVAWAVWRLVAASTARVERWLVPVVLAVLVPVSAVSAVSAARAGVPYEREATALPPIVPKIVAALPDRDGEVVVRSGTFSGNLYAAALVLMLEEQSVKIGVERANEEAFGEHRVHRDGPVRATLVIYEGLDTLFPRPDLRLVAASSDLTRGERVRLTERRAALTADHEAGTISDERYIVELGRIEARVRSTVAVFMERER